MGCAIIRAAAPLRCGAAPHRQHGKLRRRRTALRCTTPAPTDAQLCSCCARAVAKPIASLKNVDSVSHMSETGLRGTGQSGRAAERERRRCALLKNVSHMSESLRCSLGMCCTCTQSIQSIACPALPAVTADSATLWTAALWRPAAPMHTHSRARAHERHLQRRSRWHYAAVGIVESNRQAHALLQAHCPRGMCSCRAHVVSNSMQYPVHAQSTPVGRQTLQRIDRFGFDARTHARTHAFGAQGVGAGV